METKLEEMVGMDSYEMDREDTEGEENTVENKVSIENFFDDRRNPLNIAELFDEDTLSRIGRTVISETETDLNSRAEWQEKINAAMDILKQLPSAQTGAIQGMSDAKHPLILEACLQFNSRAYAAVIPGNLIVKTNVAGDDPDGVKQERADRVQQHMSYQCLVEMEEWEEDTDRLLMAVPAWGVAFKKTYFDKCKSRNVSELVLADRCIVNYYAKSIESAPRITHKVDYYPNEMVEKVLSNEWLQSDFGLAKEKDDQMFGEDSDAAHCFYEQHRWLDLDQDGYSEPYIVIVHKERCKVVSIIPRFELDSVKRNSSGQIYRIEANHHFTKFGFVPAPDGSFYDWGFSHLLGPMNTIINKTLNRLLDAGNWANNPSGLLGNGFRLQKGTLMFKPGEFKQMQISGDDIRKNFVQLQFPEPSMVLFQLLGFLTQAGRDISSIKDLMTGEQGQPNMPATSVLALIEQGLTQFTSVFKRIHRSLKQEYKKLFKLNSVYLNEEQYFLFQDSKKAVARDDYKLADFDIYPISDPSTVTKQQKIALVQAKMQLLGNPMVNSQRILQDYFKVLGEDPKQYMVEQQADPASEMMMMAQMEKMMVSIEESKAKIAKIQSESIKNLAQAESEEAGRQLDIYRAEVEAMKDAIEQGRVSGMAQQSGNQGGNAVPSGLPGVPEGAMGAGMPAAGTPAVGGGEMPVVG